MALTDRDHLQDQPAPRGRASRLDAPPTDGVIWEATADRAPTVKSPDGRRGAIVLALWLIGGIAGFTAIWGIACALIAAEWHDQGATFTPPVAQEKSHTGETIHGAH